MISFFVCLGLLILSFFTYSKYVEHVFGPTDAKTPAIRFNNGVDYVPMPLWRMVLVQLLNIAGFGPVFGAIAGALWGPSVFLWITLVPAVFMTAVSVTYFLIAPECLRLPATVAWPLGLVLTAIISAYFISKMRKWK